MGGRVNLSRRGSQQRLAFQVPVVAHLTLVGLMTITMRLMMRLVEEDDDEDNDAEDPT